MQTHAMQFTVSVSLSMAGVTGKTTSSFYAKPPMLHHTNHVVAEVCNRLPAGSVNHVEELLGHTQQIYHLTTSEGHTNLLKCPPPLTTRLLRQERQGVASEFNVLNILSSSLGTATPRIISYHIPESASAHLLLDFEENVPFSTLGPLSDMDMETLQKSMLRWLQSISSIQSGSFGAISSSPNSFHTSSWQSCFLNMFEMALEDAENMLVSLPYDRIRLHLWRYCVCLDEVVTPRLLILNALDLDNLMVNPTSMQVIGLLNYSNALWGDPELAHFHLGTDTVDFQTTPELLANTDGRQQRHLLYGLYTSTIAVIVQCLRPSGVDNELEARRLLTKTLSTFDKLISS